MNSISLSDPANDEGRRWASYVSAGFERPFVSVGWELCSVRVGWWLLWCPFVQRKRTGALHIPLSVQSCVKLSFLCRAFILPASVPPCIDLSVFCRPFRVLHSAIRLPSSVEPCVDFSVFRLLLVAPSYAAWPEKKECWESCVRVLLRLSNSGQLRTRSRQRRGAIWGLCPPTDDRVLRWEIWGLCPTSAD